MQRRTGRAGVTLDLQSTKQCAEVSARSAWPGGDHYDVTVNIEISVVDADRVKAHRTRDAYLQLIFDRQLIDGDEGKEEDTQHIELYAQELEPLAAALSRAIELAIARGFLPTKPTT